MRPSQSTRDQKASRVKGELVGEVVLVYSNGGWRGGGGLYRKNNKSSSERPGTVGAG